MCRKQSDRIKKARDILSYSHDSLFSLSASEFLCDYQSILESFTLLGVSSVKLRLIEDFRVSDLIGSRSTNSPLKYKYFMHLKYLGNYGCFSYKLLHYIHTHSIILAVG